MKSQFELDKEHHKSLSIISPGIDVEIILTKNNRLYVSAGGKYLLKIIGINKVITFDNRQQELMK